MKPEARECTACHLERRTVRLALAKVDFALDVFATEGLLGVQLVVRVAHDAQVAGLVRSAACSWDDVVEFEVRSARAPRATLIDERALLAVTLENLATHRTRNPVAYPLLLELREQHVERMVEDCLEVTRPNTVAHEISRSFELRAHLAAHGELEPVARRSQRLESRSHWRWRR